MEITTAWVKPPPQIGGLDHLAVQAPCISIYGRLLPGITNVTDRARYYSFYPWLIWSLDRQGFTRYGDEFTGRFRRTDCLAKSTCSKGLSKQAFKILPKIREVDGLLHSGLMKRHTIREVHPERCFCGLNGFRPMMHKKKSAAGFSERMDLLEPIWPESKALAAGILHTFLRKHVAEDDRPDAIVALVTALAPEGNLR